MPTMTHHIDVPCSPQALYQYITQPWLWHEWHPNSVRSSSSKKKLRVGDTFVEEISLRPLSWLPLTIHRQLNYTVIDAKADQYWEIKAVASDGGSKVHFQYHFKATSESTRFTRILRYEINGLMRLLAPILLRANQRNSAIAMANLRTRAEALR